MGRDPGEGLAGRGLGAHGAVTQRGTVVGAPLGGAPRPGAELVFIQRSSPSERKSAKEPQLLHRLLLPRRLVLFSALRAALDVGVEEGDGA